MTSTAAQLFAEQLAVAHVVSQLELGLADADEVVPAVAAWAPKILEDEQTGRAAVEAALSLSAGDGHRNGDRAAAPAPGHAFWGALWLLRSLAQGQPRPPLSARDVYRRAMKLLTSPARAWTVAEVVRLATGPDDPWVDTAVALLSRQATFVVKDVAAVAGDADAVVRGRVLSVRRHARVLFADVEGADTSQLLFDLTAGAPLIAGHDLRTGDWIEVAGSHELTRSGARALRVTDVIVHAPASLDLGKASAPSADLSPVRAQATVLRALRDALERAGFAELVTPLLTSSFYGGRARPFSTRWHAVAETQHLRLTSELALKAAVAGGIERCYEIGPSCRNEGRDLRHLPVFTVLEAYAARASVADLVALVSEAVSRAAEQLGVEVGAVRHVTARELVAATGSETDPEDVATLYRELEIVALPATTGLVVVGGLPVGPSPLIAAQEGVYRRAWLTLNGMFFADVADEEVRVDVVQRELLRQLDTDPYCVRRDYSGFLELLATGMPPTAGVGLSVPRLVAGLLGTTNLAATELRHWAP